MEQLNSVVQSTIQSGVLPLKTTYSAVWNLYGDKIVAFRGQTTVQSVVYGALTENVLDNELCGEVAVRLFVRNLKNAYTLAELSAKTGKNHNWYSVYCNVSPDELNFAELQAITGGSRLASGVCVEFPSRCLQNVNGFAKVISEFRKMGFVTAIRGYGSERFPMVSLLTATPDVVLLEPSISVQAATPSRSAAVRALVDFAVNLGCNVVALGAETDEQIRALRAANCFGVCVTDSYRGVYDCKPIVVADDQVLTLDEVNNA